jgi:hypothetical protein
MKFFRFEDFYRGRYTITAELTDIDEVVAVYMNAWDTREILRITFDFIEGRILTIKHKPNAYIADFEDVKGYYNTNTLEGLTNVLDTINYEELIK